MYISILKLLLRVIRVIRVIYYILICYIFTYSLRIDLLDL